MVDKWKLPVTFLVAGMGFKAALLILYRYFPHPAIVFLGATSVRLDFGSQREQPACSSKPEELLQKY